MHLRRASLVNNNFLKRIAVKKQFFKFIFSDKFTKSYTVPQGFSHPKETIHQGNNGEEFPMPYEYRHLPDKTIADIIESLTGLYYKEYHNLEIC